MASDTANLAHYTSLYTYIKSKGAGLMVLGNPARPPTRPTSAAPPPTC
jgi:hypothetical protein